MMPQRCSRYAARVRTPSGTSAIEAIGHVGAWAGAYCTAAAVCFVQLAGLGDTPSAALVLSVFLTATGAYALDRVKLRSEWIDPADIESQPARYAFLKAHARAVRLGAILSILAAGALGWFISVWAPAACVLAAAGVVAYAPRPRATRPRVKDVPWIKNVYVAAGISVFAALAGLAAREQRDSGADPSITTLLAGLSRPGAISTLVLLMARVIVDAALCDLDDETSDARFGTRTFATLLGPRRLWLIAGLARLGLIGMTLGAWACPWRARLVWAGVMAAGTLAVRVHRPRELRDVVDARFAAEAVAATLALRLLAA